MDTLASRIAARFQARALDDTPPDVRIASRVALRQHLLKIGAALEDVSKLRFQAVFLMGAGGSGKGFAGRKWMKYMPGGGGSGIDFEDPKQKHLEKRRLTEQERGQTNLNWESARDELASKGIRIMPLPGAKPGAKIPFNLFTYDDEGKEILVPPERWKQDLPPGVYDQVQGLKEVLFDAPVHEIPSYWRQVNPDLYKEELAGYSETQPGYVHEMSSVMAKAYFHAILETGDPLFVDGTGANAKKVEAQLKAAKAAGYRTSLIFVSVPLTVNQIRNATRPRNVNPMIVTGQWRKIATNFVSLRSEADKAKVIINRADSIDIATYKSHRDKIESFIRQTTSYNSLYDLIKDNAPNELRDWGKLLQRGNDIERSERERRFQRLEEKRREHGMAPREFHAIATEGTLYYGHKEKWGSMFLTAFALTLPIEEQQFVRILEASVQRETHRLTDVRLHKVEGTSKGGYPILTVWWGGDRGHESEETGEPDYDYTDLGSPWFVQDLLDTAIERAAKQMGFRTVKRLGHSAETDRV